MKPIVPPLPKKTHIPKIYILPSILTGSADHHQRCQVARSHRIVGNARIARSFVGRKDVLVVVLGGRLRRDRSEICLERGFSRCPCLRTSVIVSSRLMVALDGMERSVEVADNAPFSLSAISTNVERKKSRNTSTSCLVDIAPRLARTILLW
jgi:hypothetical protein